MKEYKVRIFDFDSHIYEFVISARSMISAEDIAIQKAINAEVEIMRIETSTI